MVHYFTTQLSLFQLNVHRHSIPQSVQTSQTLSPATYGTWKAPPLHVGAHPSAAPAPTSHVSQGYPWV